MPLSQLVMCLAVGTVAVVVSNPLVTDGNVTFSVYDSPQHTRMSGQNHHAADAAHRFRSDISDADYLYEHPIVLVLKQEGRDELVAFLADRGLNSLHDDDHLRLVLDALRAGGGEKVGILLDLRKHAPLAQWAMPITKFFLPTNFNLVRLARSSMLSPVGAVLPWILVVDRNDLRSSEAGRFEKVADFGVHEHYVKIPLTRPSGGEDDDQSGISIFPSSLFGRSLSRPISPGIVDDTERTRIISRSSGGRHNFPIYI